jgi:hypothetical protein
LVYEKRGGKSRETGSLIELALLLSTHMPNIDKQSTVIKTKNDAGPKHVKKIPSSTKIQQPYLYVNDGIFRFLVLRYAWFF